MWHVSRIASVKKKRKKKKKTIRQSGRTESVAYVGRIVPIASKGLNPGEYNYRSSRRGLGDSCIINSQRQAFPHRERSPISRTGIIRGHQSHGGHICRVCPLDPHGHFSSAAISCFPPLPPSPPTSSYLLAFQSTILFFRDKWTGLLDQRAWISRRAREWDPYEIICRGMGPISGRVCSPVKGVGCRSGWQTCLNKVVGLTGH